MDNKNIFYKKNLKTIYNLCGEDTAKKVALLRFFQYQELLKKHSKKRYNKLKIENPEKLKEYREKSLKNAALQEKNKMKISLKNKIQRKQRQIQDYKLKNIAIPNVLIEEYEEAKKQLFNLEFEGKKTTLPSENILNILQININKNYDGEN